MSIFFIDFHKIFNKTYECIKVILSGNKNCVLVDMDHITVQQKTNAGFYDEENLMLAVNHT